MWKNIKYYATCQCLRKDPDPETPDERTYLLRQPQSNPSAVPSSTYRFQEGPSLSTVEENNRPVPVPSALPTIVGVPNRTAFQSEPDPTHAVVVQEQGPDTSASSTLPNHLINPAYSQQQPSAVSGGSTVSQVPNNPIQSSTIANAPVVQKFASGDRLWKPASNQSPSAYTNNAKTPNKPQATLSVSEDTVTVNSPLWKQIEQIQDFPDRRPPTQYDCFNEYPRLGRLHQ